jgi:serine protease Do
MTLGLVMIFSLLCLSGWSLPGLDESVDAAKITKKVFPSVVRVEAVNGMRKVATGVVIDKQGHIVTTALISPKDEKISVINFQGDRVNAELMGMDSVTHLAVIKAEAGEWEPIRLGKAKELTLGSWIGVISVTTESAPAITQGIVSSISPNALRLNVWLMPGASGSPVVDKNGHMVGLIRGTYSGQVTLSLDAGETTRGMVFSRAEAPSSGLAMAYPVDIVERVSSEIRAKGKVERGWLGVSIADMPGGKVTVLNVDPGSPAEIANLKRGDIIQSVDGEPVARAVSLVQDIRMHRPGEKLDIGIIRDGEEFNITVTLGEYSDVRMKEEFKTKFPSLFSPPEARPSLKQVIPKGERFFLGRGDKYIGVSVQELNPELAKYFGVENGTGLLINKINKDSPADEAGLKVGDVIVQAGDIDLEEYSGLFQTIQSKEEGETLKLKVIRDKKPLTLDVKVGLDPERDFRFFSLLKKHKERSKT